MKKILIAVALIAVTFALQSHAEVSETAEKVTDTVEKVAATIDKVAETVANLTPEE